MTFLRKDFTTFVEVFPTNRPIIMEKPSDFEPDIRKAANEGKLISVQYFVEVEQRTLL